MAPLTHPSKPSQNKARSRLPYIASALAILLVVTFAYGITHSTSLSGLLSGGALESGTSPAPDFKGIVDWENSSPLTLSDLKGKVVLVDFWTYSCINCQNTFPYLRKWYEAYKDQGLVIVGVHSPEFDFEKNISNVRQAVKHYNVLWPVAVDSNHETWDAYKNQYWPAEYLIDKNGIVRDIHLGEGNYDLTEKSIRTLLAETGHKVGAAGAYAGPTPQGNKTAELYAGAGRGLNIPSSHTNVSFDYVDPNSYSQNYNQANAIYWNGFWNIGSEFAEHTRNSSPWQDYVAVNYGATEVVMVSANSGSPVIAYVTIDGQNVPASDAGTDLKYDTTGQSYILIDRSDLFSIIKHSAFERHIIKVSPIDKGFRLFTFDFNG
jgi:thiol-disulfide isomerase/thioredoxin